MSCGPSARYPSTSSGRARRDLACGNPVTRYDAAPESRRRGRTPCRKPRGQEPGVEGVAGAGRVQQPRSRARRPRTARLAAGDGGQGRSRHESPASRRRPERTPGGPRGSASPRKATASAAFAKSRSGAASRIRRWVADRPAARSGAADARSTVIVAPAARASSMARPVASASGDPRSEYAGRCRTAAPANHAGRTSPGPRRSAAPRSATKLRSPSASTSIPIRAVRAPTGRAARTVTPSRRRAADERPSRPVPPDGADERGGYAEPRQPARGVRGRAALVESHDARHVGAVLERARRRQDHVQGEVAEHDGTERPVGGAGAGEARSARVAAGPVRGRHRPRIRRGSGRLPRCRHRPRRVRHGTAIPRVDRPRGGGTRPTVPAPPRALQWPHFPPPHHGSLPR